MGMRFIAMTLQPHANYSRYRVVTDKDYSVLTCDEDFRIFHSTHSRL